jgi:hypothetical protein
MKAFALIPALLLSATPALATPEVDPVFSIDFGPATSIRSCRLEKGGPFLGVCYNRVVTSRASILSVPVSPWKRVVEHVVRLDCRRRIAYPEGSTRQAVANEFCPQVVIGVLPPAPFLF